MAASVRLAREPRSTGTLTQRRRRGVAGLGGRRGRAFGVGIGDHQVRAPAREEHRDLAADAASASDDHDDLAAELCLRRHALQLGFFERPVFDAEGFGAGQGDVIVKLFELLRLLRVASLWQYRVRL